MTENPPTPMDTPVSSLRSIGAQNHIARNDSCDTYLCRRCHELDFESRFDSRDEDGWFDFEIAIATLNPHCTLCKLFETVDPGDASLFSIQWPNGSQETLWMRLRRHASAVGLVTYDFCVRPFHPDDVGEPWSLDPAKVDFEVLRAKFEYCKANHTNTCCVKRVPVKNLRVFNCATKMLEVATVETKYAALSYVWGNPETSDKYPQTILDAFEVTQEFGLKHIWIDQLCIGQEGLHKADQIRQMHHIYNNAEVTIAAAAGCDSAYGIPGVQGKSRKERTEFKIGRLQFVESYLSPEEIMRRTAWAKRGWTFQEELFSNRLLTFTDYGAWFSCCKISPEYGREHVNPNSSEAWEDFEYDGHDYHGSNLKFPSNISHMMQSFSRRTLTYEADIINAFSGCLGRLEQAYPPVHHLWGSPIPLYLPALHNRAVLGGSLEGFLLGLQWTLQADLISLKRRVGFPSWSWTGWIGPVGMPQYGNLYESSFNSETSVALELTTGERLDWSELEKRSFLKDQPELRSRFIHLSAWTMPVKLEFCHLSQSTKPSLHAIIKTTAGGDIFCKAILLTEGGRDPSEQSMAVLKRKVITGILLTASTRPYVMLVSEMDQYSVRVGFALMWFPIKQGSSGNVLHPASPDFKPDLNYLQMERREIRLG